MNNKIIILLVSLVVLFNQKVFGQGVKSKKVILCGLVKNYNNQIQIEDMSEMKELNLPNSDRTFTLDSNNHFSLSFELEKPGYFRLGRNILYLSPGDSLSMFINWIWQDSSVFKGTGSQANEYLKSIPFPKGGSFLDAGYNIKTTLKQTVNEIFKTADKSISLLKKITNVSNNFKFLERARVDADVLNSLEMIKAYFPYMNKIKKDSLENFKTEYAKIVSPYVELYAKKINLNPAYLQLGVYRQVVSSILSQQPTNTRNKQVINDWIKAEELVQQFNKVNDKKGITSFDEEIKKIGTQRYRAAVVKTFEKLMKFRNGDFAIDFEMTDTGKNSIPLSSFKGKVIYIDLWATWCGPCIEELPFLDSLKERYKNNGQIIFIALSIDSDREKWIKNLANRNASNNQYIIDRVELEAYSVTEIPRAIIIDREFKIADMNGNLPSSKNLLSFLNVLMQ